MNTDSTIMRRRAGSILALVVLFAVPALVMLVVCALMLSSCAPNDPAPTPLYPEDQCSSCRMTISNKAFASEIISDDGTVLKFDDLRCLEDYRQEHPDEHAAAIFVTDYESGEWMPYAKGIVVPTGIETPMGSGRIAVSTQEAASRLKELHPAKLTSTGHDACCGKPKEVGP